MLMPAGIPLEANVTMSREVKSGRKKESFSNSGFHGNSLSRPSADITRL